MDPYLIDLTEVELIALKEIVANSREALRSEIRRTDTLEFRNELKERASLLAKVQERLEAPVLRERNAS